MVTFGHLGDGSLHYNVAAPKGVSDESFLTHQAEINRIVYDCVNQFKGVISAEHGLGALKHVENASYKSGIGKQADENPQKGTRSRQPDEPGQGIAIASFTSTDSCQAKTLLIFTSSTARKSLAAAAVIGREK